MNAPQLPPPSEYRMDCGAALAFLLKLQRSAPRSPCDVGVWARFTRLFIRIAALLPHHEVDGLGDTQREVVRSAIRLASVTARSALRNPRGELTAALIDLLHTVAEGSKERLKESSFVPRSQLDRQFLTHRYVQRSEVESQIDGLAQGELFYESLCAGLRRMEKIGSKSEAELFDSLDEAIHCVPVCVSTMAAALLFDGSRLRRGLEVGVQVSIDKDSVFGMKRGMAYMLSDGETNTERLRVGASLQFVIAACLCGCKDLGEKMTPAVSERAEKLKRDAYDALHSCRDKVESKCLVPSRSMRLILDLAADLVEQATLGDDGGAAELVLRTAFGYPCLVPVGLQDRSQYDGGLLSVWDACLHLFELQSSAIGEILSVPALLCAVLAGVTGSLMTSLACGPFRVHPKSDVAVMAGEIHSSWPSTPILASTGLKQGRLRGKPVNVNAAMRGSSLNDSFRVERRSTPLSEAKTSCTYTMMALNHLLLEGPGVHEGAPSDGVVALKRMYVYSIALELGVDTMHAISETSIHTLWRDLLGGSLVSKGALCSFTRSGLRSSLRVDWCPSGCEESSCEEASTVSRSASTSTTPVRMLPAVACALAFSRAKNEVEMVTEAVMREVHEDGEEGPVYVLRVCETLQVLSGVVHTARSGSLWECLVSRFCTSRGLKRGAEEGVEEGVEEEEE